MAKTYRPFPNGGYGWVGMGPAELALTINKSGIAIKKLQKELEFEAVAFCGSSGAAIAFHLGIKYKIPLIYVRKKDEECHGSSVECNGTDLQVKKYLIVDDFIDSGKTMRHIIGSIGKHTKDRSAYPAKPVGIFCYDGCQAGRPFVVTPRRKIPIFVNKD